jgi:hypothetical protein
MNVALPVMSLFAFGQPAGTVSTGKAHFAMPIISGNMRVGCVLGG